MVYGYVERKLYTEWEQQQGGRSNEKGGILERRELKKATKTREYNAMGGTNKLYGCETWTLMERHKSRLGATEMVGIYTGDE